MYKKLTCTFGILALLLSSFWLASGDVTTLGMIRADRALVGFESKAAVTNHFAESKVPIAVLPLKKYANDNLLFAAYPYSGSDTIDLYWFIKYGESWRVRMTFFVLSPHSHELTVKETNGRIFVYCANQEITSCIVGTPSK